MSKIIKFILSVVFASIVIIACSSLDFGSLDSCYLTDAAGAQTSCVSE